MLKQINLKELDTALLSSIFITKCDLSKALNQGPDNYIFHDLLTDIPCENIIAMYYVRQSNTNDIIIIVEEDSISLYINRTFDDGEESYNIFRNLTYDELVNILKNSFNITIEMSPQYLIEKQFTAEQRTHVRNEVIVFSKPDLLIIVDLVNNVFKVNNSLWYDLTFEYVNEVLKENIK